VFPVRYGLSVYILFRKNLIFKGLNIVSKSTVKIMATVQIFCVLCIKFKLSTKKKIN
jgi:hypothetical protein